MAIKPRFESESLQCKEVQTPDEHLPAQKTSMPAGTSHDSMPARIASTGSPRANTPQSKLPRPVVTPKSGTGSPAKDRGLLITAARSIGLELGNATNKRKNRSVQRTLDVHKPNPAIKATLVHGVDASKKPLPSQPIAQVVTSSPIKQSRTLLDASDQPLRRSPITAEEGSWPILSPAKPATIATGKGSTPPLLTKQPSYHSLKAKHAMHTNLVASPNPASPNNVKCTIEVTQPAVYSVQVKGDSFKATPQVAIGRSSALMADTFRFPATEGLDCPTVVTSHPCSIGKQLGFADLTWNDTDEPVSDDPTLEPVINREKARVKRIKEDGQKQSPSSSVPAITDPSTRDGDYQELNGASPTHDALQAQAETRFKVRRKPSPTVTRSTGPSSGHDPIVSTIAVESPLVPARSLRRSGLPIPKRTPSLSTVGNDNSQTDTTKLAFADFFSAAGTPSPVQDLALEEVLNGDKDRSINAGPHRLASISEVESPIKSRMASPATNSSVMEPSETTTSVDRPIFSDPTDSINQGFRIKRLSIAPHALEYGPILTIADDAQKIIMGDPEGNGDESSPSLKAAFRKSKDRHSNAATRQTQAGTPISRQNSRRSVRGNKNDQRTTSGSDKRHAGGSILTSAAQDDQKHPRNFAQEHALALSMLEGTCPSNGDQGIDLRLSQNSGKTMADQTDVQPAVLDQGQVASSKVISQGFNRQIANMAKSVTQIPLPYTQTTFEQRPPYKAMKMLGMNGQYDCDFQKEDSCELGQAASSRDILNTSVQGRVGSQHFSNNTSKRPPSAASSLSFPEGPAVPPKDVPFAVYPSYATSSTSKVARTSNHAVRNSSRAATGHYTPSSSPPPIPSLSANRPSSRTLSPIKHPSLSSRKHFARSSDPESYEADEESNMAGPEATNNKRSRSRSRTRIAMSNIRGFFQKRETKEPELPATKVFKSGRKVKTSSSGSPTQGIGLVSSLHKPTKASQARANTPTIARTVPRHIPIPSRIPSESVAESPAVQSAEPTGMAETTTIALDIITQARGMADSAEKERLLSIAQIMVDTVKSARTAQKSMLEAEQAAKQARMSYELTQRSIVEIARMMSQSSSMKNLLRLGHHGSLERR